MFTPQVPVFRRTMNTRVTHMAPSENNRTNGRDRSGSNTHKCMSPLFDPLLSSAVFDYRMLLTSRARALPLLLQYNAEDNDPLRRTHCAARCCQTEWIASQYSTVLDATHVLTGAAIEDQTSGLRGEALDIEHEAGVKRRLLLCSSTVYRSRGELLATRNQT